MQGFVDFGNKGHLLHLLDILKEAAQSNHKKLDADRYKTMSDVDSKFDKERINNISSEIKDIFVSMNFYQSSYSLKQAISVVQYVLVL